MKKHISRVHDGKIIYNGSKLFKCRDCDAAFSQKHHLKGHIESVHQEMKPFECSIIYM